MNVRSSLFFSFLNQNCGFLLQFGTSVILARVLTPAEIGVYSIGMSIIGMVHVLRDFGTTTFLIQEKSLDDATLRTVFTISLVASWLLSGLLFLLAPAASTFYNQPGLISIINIIAINFLILPFNSTSMAMLRREMAFSAILRVDLYSTFLNNAITIILALYGLSYLSMAWGALAGMVTTTLLNALFRPHLVFFKPSLKGAKKIFSFGSLSTLTSAISTLGLNAPDLVIGRLQGVREVGLYSRGIGLVTILGQLLLRAVEPVLLPFFANARRTRNAREIRASYLKAISYITAVNWLLLGMLYILAEPIVEVLYGSQWLGTIPIVKALSLAFALRTVSSLDGSVLIALGGMRQQFLSQLFLQSLRVVLTIYAAQISVLYVAELQIGFYAVVFLVYHIQIYFKLHIRLLDVLLHTAKSALISMTAIYVCHVCQQVIPFAYGGIAMIGACGLASVCAWVAIAVMVRHPLVREITPLLVRTKPA